jgi:hypothetical protein
MLKTAIVMTFTILISCLSAQLHWQNTFFSSPLADHTQYVRTQAEGDSLSLLLKTASGITMVDMLPLQDGYAGFQAQFDIPEHDYLGFRLEHAPAPDVLPVYHSSGNMPAWNELTPLSTDAAGDHNFNQTNLDIRAAYATFDDDKLYFAITNNGGGFPTGSGFTFYAYMATLVNPEADSTANTTVYGLMHTVNIAGIISPGLYKITGTGTDDLTLIGQITTQTDAAHNTLIMSCNLADLLSDADFSGWYNPNNPRLGFMALTNKITLTGGSQVADQSPVTNILPVPMLIRALPASLPNLSNVILSEADSTMTVAVDYLSAEHYFPLTRQITFDNNLSFEFYPVGLPYYDQSLTYVANIPVQQIQGWTSALLSFSCNNADFSQLTIYPTPSADQTADSPAAPALMIFPNPARDILQVKLKSLTEQAEISIYDLRGKLCFHTKQQPQEQIVSLNLVALPAGKLSSGVYLMRVSDQKSTHTTRFCLIN